MRFAVQGINERRLAIFRGACKLGADKQLTIRIPQIVGLYDKGKLTRILELHFEVLTSFLVQALDEFAENQVFEAEFIRSLANASLVDVSNVHPCNRVYKRPVTLRTPSSRGLDFQARRVVEAFDDVVKRGSGHNRMCAVCFALPRLYTLRKL